MNSAAIDFYTETKKAQEAVVLASGNPVVVLRPTLMFGWFDRKHLGWLARFMRRSPVFPVPGTGRYLRQPLYAGDFCDIIMACLERRIGGDGIQHQRPRADRLHRPDAHGARGVRRHGPGWSRSRTDLFWLMLATYALVDSDPPFTTKQLDALVTPETFEVIDWPGIFGVRATPLREAHAGNVPRSALRRPCLEF